MEPPVDEREEMTGRGIRGVFALRQALSQESFPMSRTELYYAVGDLVIEDGRGLDTEVWELLDEVDRGQFESAEDAVVAICAAGNRRC